MKWLIIIFTGFALGFQANDGGHSQKEKDSIRVELLLEYSRLNSNFITSKNIIDSAFVISHNNIFHRGKASSYDAYGDLYLLHDSVIRSINYYSLSEIGFKDLKLDKEIAAVQYKLAKTYQSIDLYNESNQAFIRLLKTYKKIGSREDQIKLEIAENYKNLNMKDSSDYWIKVLEDKSEYIDTFSKTFQKSKKHLFKKNMKCSTLKMNYKKLNLDQM